MLLSLHSNESTGNPKPFRMEPMWCNHPSFRNLVNQFFATNSDLLTSINHFQKECVHCNKSTFGNIFKKLRVIRARLEGIQKSDNYYHSSFLQNLEKDLCEKYDSLLKAEKDFWITKSRITWLSEGDASTNFSTQPPWSEKEEIRLCVWRMIVASCMRAKKISSTTLLVSSRTCTKLITCSPKDFVLLIRLILMSAYPRACFPLNLPLEKWDYPSSQVLQALKSTGTWWSTSPMLPKVLGYIGP